jgi:hypothetical protein
VNLNKMESSSTEPEMGLPKHNAGPVRLVSFSHSSNSLSQFTNQRLTSEERKDILKQIKELVSSAEANGPYEHGSLSLITRIDSDRAGVAAAALSDSELLQSLVELFEAKWVGMSTYLKTVTGFSINSGRTQA